MTLARKNASLNSAREAKKDEFYTQLTDINNELAHYEDHFRGKVVYCNCDDPWVSNFFKYFSLNFERLGLKRLITTCYKSQDMNLFSTGAAEQAVWLDYHGVKNGNRVPDVSEIGTHRLAGDGDFRSDESIALLRQADIVVTNPPFSLFREYLQQLIDHDKKFLIVGNQNAITYRDIFLHIKENRIWLGNKNGDMAFRVPEHYEARETRFWVDQTGQKWRSLGNACWFTNLDFAQRYEDFILYKRYTPEAYPTYDNYAAIEVSKIKDIPCDYYGPMGVPITFLDKHSPKQFEIIGATESEGTGFSNGLWDPVSGVKQGLVNGNRVFKRIFIRRIAK